MGMVFTMPMGLPLRFAESRRDSALLKHGVDGIGSEVAQSTPQRAFNGQIAEHSSVP